MEPLLYRVAVVRDRIPSRMDRDPLVVERENALISPRVFAAAIERHPAAFFHTHVRHLFLDCRAFGGLEQRNTVLAVCTGAIDVHLLNIKSDGAPSLLAGVSRMPLRHLEANLGNLFGSPLQPTASVDFSLQMFQRITHLAVFDNLDTTKSDWSAGLALLPCLTHLSFQHNESHPLFAKVLAACGELRVFAVLVSSLRVGGELSAPLKALKALEQDPKVVIMKDHKTHEGENDWHRGARGLGDYWEVAEDLIRERRLGRPSTELTPPQSKASNEFRPISA
jgi:hypothetical protein